MRFRQFVWDPWRLTAQMVAMQSLYYLTMGTLLFFVLMLTFGSPVDLDYMLSERGMQHEVLGWFVVAAHALSAMARCVLDWVCCGCSCPQRHGQVCG